MAQKNSGFSLSGLIDVGVITTIVIGLLYTAGWSYAYHYFSLFHLGLLGLDIKREYFFLYGFWVLKGNLVSVLACLSFTIGLYTFLCYLQRQVLGSAEQGSALELYADSKPSNSRFPKWLRAVIPFVAPAYLLLLFIVFYQLGTWTGRAHFDKQLQNDFPSYPRVKVWLTADKDDDAKQRGKEWAGGCYRLLLRNKEHLYFFPAYDMGDKIPTEIITKNKVETIRVLPLYQSSVECR